GSCYQRSPGEIEEGQEEGARRKRDREPEHDLDQSAHSARGLAKGEREARADDDDNRDDLGDRTLDAVEDLGQRLFPGHVRARRARARRLSRPRHVLSSASLSCDAAYADYRNAAAAIVAYSDG